MTGIKRLLQSELSFTYNAPFFLAILLITNSVLSYSTLSPEAKLWWFLLGLCLPLTWAFRAVSKNDLPGPALHLRETMSLSGWPWIAAGAGGVLLRFYQWSVLKWPSPDEGLFSFYSLELARKWDWHFFFSQSQHPALFNWILALFFKCIPLSLSTLWLFPTLLSILTLAAGYSASRRFFSNSMAFFCFSLLALSLWPIRIGRFCLPFALGLYWEILALVLLSLFLKSNPKNFSRRAFWLGLLIGAGFWAAIPWALIALMTVIPVVSHFREKQNLKNLTPFWAPLSVLLLLFIAASLAERNGEHIFYLLAFSQNAEFKKQIMDSFGYITALFWKYPHQDDFGPLWGGMFNPVLSSLFFLGAVESWRTRPSSFTRWIWSALLLGLLPGLLTSEVDTFRVFLSVPFLLVVAALGLQSATRLLAGRNKTLAAISLLLVSASLDFHHLQLYSSFDSGQSTPNYGTYLNSYNILKEASEKMGPGAVLSNLGPSLDNQTLSVAAFSFDASFNRRWSFKDCRWAAVLVNLHYKPFLTARFPNSSWFEVGPDPCWHFGSLTLVVIPLTNSNRPVLQHWFEANRSLQPGTLNILHAHARQSQKSFIDDILESYHFFKTDPFLASVWAERILFYKNMDGSPPVPLELIQQELKDGYPLENFLTAEGVLLERTGKISEARSAFQKALQAPLHLTPAGEYLSALPLDRPHRGLKK